MDTLFEENALKLDNQLCFPLYAASREVIKLYRPFLDPLDLTYTQYIAMMVFWEEETVSVKRLGKKLYLDSGTLTPVVKSLEQKGLVKKYRDPEDERVVLCEITEKGQALKQEALSVPAGLAKCLPLDMADAAKLYELLYKLLDTFEKT